MTKILILTTYPYSKPYHGGQHRVKQISNVLEKAGYSISSIAVYEPQGYSFDELGPHDIPFIESSLHRKYQGENIPSISDYLSGIYLVDDIRVYETFIKTVLNLNPDIIYIEQPWLFKAAQLAKMQSPSKEIKLIYGSANIEAEMKKEILMKEEGIKDHVLKGLLKEIKKTEIFAANNSDMTLTVSKKDAKWYQLNSHAKNIYILPNGVVPTNNSDNDIMEFRAEIKCDKYLLFAASAHMPNINGFKEYIGNSLACFPPNLKLVIVGTCSSYLEPYLIDNPLFSINQNRLFCLGKITQQKFDVVLAGAHGILLPISSGGGTNLKTAEAIYSGKYVIGSNLSFRGFEEYKTYKGIMISDTQQSFRNNIELVSKLNIFDRSEVEKNMLRKLTWEHRLKVLPRYISDFII